VDDSLLIINILKGKNDFSQFVTEIEAYLKSENREEQGVRA
jgi:hypothetical protein